MPQCKPGSLTRLTLLFVLVGLGALFTVLVLFFAIYLFYRVFPEQERKLTIHKRVLLILGLIALERVLRLYETYTRFHSNVGGIIVAGVTNAISVIWPFIMFHHQIYRLTLTFQGTAYEMGESETLVLKGLLYGVALLMVSWIVLSMFPFGSKTLIGQIIGVVLAGLCMVTVIVFLGFLNWSSVSRLTECVANSTAHSGSNTSMKMMKHIQQVSSVDSNSDVSIFPVRLSLEGARVSNFDLSQQPLLKAASKGCVIISWLSLGCLILFVSVILYSLEECLHVWLLVGNGLFSLYCVICSFIMLVTLSNRIFTSLCILPDRLLQKLSAAWTIRELKVISVQMSDPNLSGLGSTPVPGPSDGSTLPC